MIEHFISKVAPLFVCNKYCQKNIKLSFITCKKRVKDAIWSKLFHMSNDIETKKFDTLQHKILDENFFNLTFFTFFLESANICSNFIYRALNFKLHEVVGLFPIQ